MERTEPTFVPEWLKSTTGGLSTSHQSSPLHPDEQGVSKSKSVRNKSLDNELGRTTTSSYFRRSSISNGSALSRSYSSFNRNNRDNRDWEKDNNNNRLHHNKDYSDPLLGNILASSRFEKEGLRRSFSSVSGKRGDTSSSSWPRKVASDVSIGNKSSSSSSSISLSSNVKASFERDFPSLEKQVDNVNDNNNNNNIGIGGRVQSPGLSSAIQSLPAGNQAVIGGGDGWTSALAEVPVIVGSSNGGVQVQPPSSVPATVNMTGGRNMAETLAHGPPRTQTAPQLNVGTQRLEELAVKQSRQLIPMTPSMPKALAMNSDKPKLKVNHHQQLVNNHHPHSPRPMVVSVKPPDVSKPSKLLVLKPSRERNNGVSPSPTTKESLSLSPTKLPNSPLAVSPSLPSKNPNNTLVPEKRPSSQAQSRNNFFNLMRQKSMTGNSSVAPETGSSGQVAAAPPRQGGGGAESAEVVKVKQCSSSSNGGGENGNVGSGSGENGKNDDEGGDVVLLYSEEEEARFLRSLGWDETGDEEEEGGLTEEEISSFYRNYMSLKGTEAKVLLGPESKVDA